MICVLVVAIWSLESKIATKPRIGVQMSEPKRKGPDRKRIGLREVRALGPVGIIWDDKVTGFAARRQKGDAVTYLVKYRTAEGRQRWYVIGRHGSPWTPDAARDRAREVLTEVTKGADPGKEAN